MKSVRHIFTTSEIIFYKIYWVCSEVKELHTIKIAFLDYLESLEAYGEVKL
jgi:hypothetical protein